MKKHFTKLVFTFLTIVLLGQAGISQTYIWGGPGDPNSEFAGGLNDWTTHGDPDSALWVWKANGAADQGAYYRDFGPIESPSVSNGAAVFDSDFYDNGGTPGNFGGGKAATPHTGYLESPVFSCEGHESVFVQFSQYFHQFSSITSLQVSIDGGITWKDGPSFNTRIPLYGYSLPTSVQLLDISSIAANQSEVKIRFVFAPDPLGPQCYYFWVIDDVYVIDSPQGDPIIDGSWFPANRFNTPKSQIANDSMYFLMYVINRGTTNKTDIKADVSLINDDLEITYFTDETTFDLNAGDTTIVFFKSFWPENLDTGFYKAIYSINVDNAATTDGKQYIQYFNVNANSFEGIESTDSIYSNIYTIGDRSHGQAVSWQNGGEREAYHIVYYKMADWVNNNSIDIIADNATFAIAGPSSYSANMYMWSVADTVDNQFYNFDFSQGLIVDNNDNNQLNYIGYASESIENGENYTDVTVPLYDIDDEEGIRLEPNKKYLLGNFWPKGDTYFQTWDNWYRGYTRFYDQYNKNYFISQNLSFLYIDFGSGPRLYTVSDNIGAWAIDLHLKIVAHTTATDDELLPDNSVTLVQNPVNTDLNVKVDFENTVDKATMVVHNINGDIIDMRTVKNIQKGSYKFYTGNLPVGTYIFTIFTKDKMLSKKFVVQH